MLALPAGASAHAERTAYFPNFDPISKQFLDPFGKVPEYRTNGRKLVVCQEDSDKRIQKLPNEEMRNRNEKLLEECEYRNIQDAVNDAKNDTRILILPGVYTEKPSRQAPDDPEECRDLMEDKEGGDVPTYEYQVKCPNAKNLIAILGDSLKDDDRECDRKCDLQIEGTARRKDVVIKGDRRKLNVIRADRADGIYLRNFTVQFADANNIYAVETNGFVFKDIVSRWAREYGFLTFTSDQGLYTDLEAYGAGDSGIYPGAGPEGHCQRYGIEIRRVDSHGNNMGYSGTAGNGVWVHDSKFRGNGAGMITDSFVPNHPGMPEDCAKWENNEVYSNNLDIYNAERDEYCKQPYEKRDPKIVCSTFGIPNGTGMLIAGGNSNLVRNNRVWDNWRMGIALLYVPEELRGEDPTGQSENNNDQTDVSHFNRFLDNRMGVDRKGKRDPNGVDFWWDEQGEGNCWAGNKGPGGAAPTTDPPEPVWSLKADCPGAPTRLPVNAAKSAFIVSCSTYDPQTNTDPPGCEQAGSSWFEQPPEPQ